MLNLISKLQKKPEPVRNKIAIGTSLGLTGIIVVLWLISFSFSEPATVAVTSEKEDGPFKALVDGISVFYDDASTALKGAVGTFSKLSDAPPAVPPVPSNEEPSTETISR